MRNITNIDLIEAALNSLKSLKPREKPNYTAVATKYGCNRSILSKCHRGVQNTRQAQYKSQRILNDTQSAELVRWIHKLTEKGLPSSNEMLCNFAKEIRGRGKKPGRQ